jgi:hypothetical protein
VTLSEAGDTFHFAISGPQGKVSPHPLRRFQNPFSRRHEAAVRRFWNRCYSSPAFFISLPAPAATSFTNASILDGFVVLLWPAQISLFCFRE